MPGITRTEQTVLIAVGCLPNQSIDIDRKTWRTEHLGSRRRILRPPGGVAHIPRVKLRCADPLQEFHLGERFLLWRFRRHSVRQPYRVSEEIWFGNMTKSPTRELPPQTNDEPPPRRRNIYDDFISHNRHVRCDDDFFLAVLVRDSNDRPVDA